MTIPRNISSWLPNLIGPLDLQADGAEVTTRRATINFIDSDIEDDPENERTNITFAPETVVSAAATPNYSIAAPARKHVAVDLFAASSVISLPTSPSDGDRYEVSDPNYTAGAQKPLIVSAGARYIVTPAGPSTTDVIITPGTCRIYRYLAIDDVWMLISSTVGESNSFKWRTAYDLDFTILPLSAVAGNGNFTIDGKTWTVANFAKAPTMSVGGADGLRILTNTTISNSDVGTNSAALFRSPSFATLLSGIVPDDIRMGVRVSFYTKAFTRGQTNDATTFMLCTSAYDAQRTQVKQYRTGGAVQTDFMSLALNGSVKTGTDIAATLTNHDCVQMELHHLGAHSTMIHTGIYNSGWPSKWFCRAYNEAAAAVWINTGFQQLSDAYVVIAQACGGGGATTELKVGRMKLEYLTYE